MLRVRKLGAYLLGLMLSCNVLACTELRTPAESGSVQASGPLQVDAVNPRYFSDGSGRVVYLVGSHTWRNLQDVVSEKSRLSFDYSEYLRFLTRYHLNFFRLWRQEDALFEPMPYLRTGPVVALDGGPKFDVNRINPLFFEREMAMGRALVYSPC